MGIYDRDYYRDDEPRGFQLGLSQSAVINLILVNVAVYVVDLFLEGSLSNHMALSADLVLRPWNAWQLITNGFAHDPRDVWHLIFNMLALWFFGRDVEQVYGARLFLKIYISLVICASLCWLVAKDIEIPRLFWELANARGASGAISGVIALFICHFPRRTIYLYMVFPVPAWIFAVIWLGRDIVGMVKQDDNIGYTAHLGGAAFGYLYYKTHWHLLGMLPSRLSSPVYRPKPPLRVHRPVERDDDLSTQADAILEKISVSGQDSLTAQERRVLEEYSRRMQQKRR